MLKSILLPTIIAGLIAIPVIYHKSTAVTLEPGFDARGEAWSQATSSGGVQPFTRQANQSDIYGGTVAPQSIFHEMPPASPALRSTVPTRQVAALPNASPRPFALPAMRRPAAQVAESSVPVSSVSAPSQNSMTAADAWGVTSRPVIAAATMRASVSGSQAAFSATPDVTGLTPDFGKAETIVYRGTAAGPDLTAQPLSFVPVNDFREVFRFDINESWVKQRFERISTVPSEAGLHGLRTAMVTGTNSWDLHGSQTYYFDANHRLQRITFRGWVGDSTRLLEMATQNFGLKPKPTHWAGLYLGNFGGKLTGGLIMKDPDVIDRRNQLQRSAVLMEINQPSGKFQISDDFRGLLQSAAGQ